MFKPHCPDKSGFSPWCPPVRLPFCPDLLTPSYITPPVPTGQYPRTRTPREQVNQGSFLCFLETETFSHANDMLRAMSF